MSRIILFGGHGHVARLATPLLVQAGHTVTSIIRNPDQVAALVELGAEPVVADLEKLTIEGFGGLIDGHDTIAWAAGAGGGSPSRTWAIDRDAAVYSVQAALIGDVRRYLMVSWSGSRIDHRIAQTDDFFPYSQAKAIADSVIRDSGLDYTIVAPGRLTNDPASGGVERADDAGSVSRADVAALVVAALDNPASIGRTYRFNSGTIAPADFIAMDATR
ncbi:MAG TPA: NAD(P)H-binding protein [Microthrixaceae bacterium]|jgi:uncharacterized protein YbjT (DUF2867 family)|nr:NAD(P)H-binding protein [Microthrixaceae bacterium]